MRNYSFFVWLLAFGLLTGCKSCQTPTSPIPISPVVIADNVVVPENKHVVVNTLGHGDTLQLDFGGLNKPMVKVGDILVGTSNGGYLRKVTQVVDSTGTSVILLTKQAKLTEVIKKGKIDTTLAIQPQQQINFGPIKKTGKLKNQETPVTMEIGSGYVRPTAVGLEIKFEDLKFFIEDDTLMLEELGIEGNVDLVIEAEFDWGGVKYLKVVFETTLTKTILSDIDIEAAVFEDIKHEIPLPEIPLGAYVIPVAFVPVPVTVSFEPEIKFSASSPSLRISDLEIAAELETNAGIEYSAGNFRPISEIQLVPTFDVELDINTKFEAALSAQGSILTKIFGVAGPGLSMEPGGYLEFDLANSCLEGGFFEKVNAAFEFEIFGLEFDREFTLHDERKPYLKKCPENRPPVIKGFAATPTRGAKPLQVTFDYNFTDGDNDELSRVIYFGDGNLLNLNNNAGSITHTYSRSGVHEAILEVKDGNAGGKTSADLKIIVTEGTLNTPPIVHLAANPLAGVSPLAVNISYRASDPDGDLVLMKLDYGDGPKENFSQSAGNLIHTYNDSGEYVIRLTADDGQGGSSTDSAHISVRAGATIPINGLLAYYPFSGDAKDNSGNGHHGMVDGATLTADRFGNTGRAYGFDGINDYISVSGINITTDLSISFWAKTTASDNDNWPSGQFIIDRDLCGVMRDWSVGLGRGGKIQFNTGTHIVVDSTLTSTLDINDGLWRHIVVTRETASRNKNLFVNGKLNTSALFDNLPFLNSSIDIYFGASVCLTAQHNFFNGSLDDIRIFNRALTEAEIQALYHEGGWK